MTPTCATCGMPLTVIDPGGGRCAQGHVTPRVDGRLIAGPNGHRTTEPAWSADRQKLAAGVKRGVPAESKLTFRTAAEIAATTSEHPDWVACPWVVSGGITELVGKIKSAGKTTWTTHVVRAVLDGTPFMGRPTTQGPVVYLSEQSDTSLREALRRAGLLDRDDLHFLTWHNAAGNSWPGIVAAATAQAQAVGAVLLVVDTLAQFAGLRGDDENGAGAALAAMAPLQAAANGHGLGVLVIRHERKSGGEVGESGRGSSAFGGAVDIVLQLRRGEGNSRPSIRVLSALSRYDETPDQLTIELRDGVYVALGDTTAVVAHEARETVLATLPVDDTQALTLDELIAATRYKRTSVQSSLDVLTAEGIVARAGQGKRGDAYRWHRVAVAAGTTGVLAESNGHAAQVARMVSAGTLLLTAAESKAFAAASGGIVP